MLTYYTTQQSRIAFAFGKSASCCSEYCEACGRTYFITSSGHGDYSEGELEKLRALAEQEPDKCIEVPDFDSIATIRMPNGKRVIIGCACDPTRPLSDFIEDNAAELTDYLRRYWRDIRREAAKTAERAARVLAELGWSGMNLAPKDSSWIEAELQDGNIVTVHWASDLSGEEQPPYEGWFTVFDEEDERAGYRQVFPIHWRKLRSTDD